MTRPSVETIVEALERAGVRYLIVGGLAVVAHGHVRFTADVDLVLAAEPENLRSAIDVLRSLGYGPRAPVPIEAFLDAAERARWRTEKGMVVFAMSSPQHPATEVDLFLEPPFEFETAWSKSVRMDLAAGVPARFVALADLLAMKRAAGRPVDHLDVDALARLHPEEGR